MIVSSIAIHSRKAPETAVVDGVKPRKRHRTKAYSWLLRIDNALQHHCGTGLSHYQVKEPDTVPASEAALWPRLSIVADRGSGGISAVHFAQRRLMLNIDYLPDASHDHWNELREALKECDLWPHILIAVIAYNCDFAPWGQDAFYCQLRESFAEYLLVAHPLSCPMWSEYWPRILVDRDETSRMTEPNIALTPLSK